MFREGTAEKCPGFLEFIFVIVFGKGGVRSDGDLTTNVTTQPIIMGENRRPKLPRIFQLCFRYFIFGRGRREKCPGFFVSIFTIFFSERAENKVPKQLKYFPILGR